MLLRILTILLLLSSAAAAQTIYEPIQYQYSDGHRVFYYGGSNPRIIARGFFNAWLAHGTPLPPAVYIDKLPLRNAALFGYTPDDAHNDARFAVLRYFRKKDLAQAAPARSLDERFICRQ